MASDDRIIDSMVRQIVTFVVVRASLVKVYARPSQAGLVKREGARLIKLVERLTGVSAWHWYQDNVRKTRGLVTADLNFCQPQHSESPTVFAFSHLHLSVSINEFLDPRDTNGYRISALALRMPWLPLMFILHQHLLLTTKSWLHLIRFQQPSISLHSTQFSFWLHRSATSRSIFVAPIHCLTIPPIAARLKKSLPNFYNASNWTTERLVNQIVSDEPIFL